MNIYEKCVIKYESPCIKRNVKYALHLSITEYILYMSLFYIYIYYIIYILFTHLLSWSKSSQ